MDHVDTANGDGRPGADNPSDDLLNELQARFPVDEQTDFSLRGAAFFLIDEKGCWDRVALDPLREWNRMLPDPWADEDLSKCLKEVQKELHDWHFAQAKKQFDAQERDSREARERQVREWARQREAETVERVRAKYQLTDASALTEGQPAQDEWLIDDVALANEPLLFAGPEKALKTTIAVDAGVSVASGSLFLGRFPVSQRRRVAFFNGESGKSTFEKKLRLICASKGIRPDDLRESFVFAHRLPSLSSPEDLRELQVWLKSERIQAAFLDPLYRCLFAGQTRHNKVQASNRHQMGPLLDSIARTFLDVGATPVFIDHTRKHRGRRPLGLGDLAWAGMAEFARHWLLINHRRAYDAGTGSSKLWLTVGGSAGQASLWKVDIEEGVLTRGHDGRKWEVAQVVPADDSGGGSGEPRNDDASEGSSGEPRSDDVSDRVLRAIDELTRSTGGVPSYTRVRTATRLTTNRLNSAVAQLVQQGLVEEVATRVASGRGGAARSARSEASRRG